MNMEHLQLIKNKKGQSIVEMLVVIGLMAIMIPGLLTGFVASRESKPQTKNRLEAITYLKEAKGALRIVREEDWDNIITSGAFHPEISGSTWVLQPGSETIGGNYVRNIEIFDVYRDSSGDIVDTGGTLDPSTKRAGVIVSWSQPIPASVSSSVYLTRYFGNTTWTQSTEAEFTEGTNINTSVKNNNGGEIELTESTGGDWTSPIEVDSYDASGNNDGYSVFSQGNYLYLGTDEFYILDVSDPFDITLVGSEDVGADKISSIYIDGDYAYLATDRDEFVVVDISDKNNPTQVDSIDFPRGNDAYGIFKSGNYVFVARDQTAQNNGELYAIDASDPTNTSLVSDYEIGADANDVFVVGDYAYLATAGNELEVIDVSDPSNMSSAGSYNTSSNADGEGIYVDGGYAYLVTANDGGGDELFILDVSDPTNPTLEGSFDVGGSANGVFVQGDYVFVASDNPSGEFQVIDATDKGAPSLYGSYILSKGVNDVTVLGNYAYLGMNDRDREAIVIEGGFGAAGDYQVNGTFESQVFDAGEEVAFNSINFSSTQPTGTDIRFQVATNNDGVSWSFYGPDGTSGTYFEGQGGIALNSVLGRYLKFKAYLTGDGSDTPILEDVTINYSP